ncbi:hypothetical protein COL60_10650 [Bacillus pseudomycoides]|uniref:hypothetical protein n=1 Tax=Bacillus pseudomycoides TaxID=64104 RepID=UPI000BF4DCDD|nr:hypothetical protein [Bacillus pseudomycoides]PFZ10351.1 hypothetical protein COL60_10650 [Bacillus pseudomycoides]
MILSNLKPFLTIKWLIGTLLGLMCTSAYSIYVAICPLLNTGKSFSIPVFWPVMKYQTFGFTAIVLTLVVLIFFPVWKKIYKWVAARFKDKYDDWFDNNLSA